MAVSGSWAQHIHETAHKTFVQFASHDPFSILQQMGIKVKERPMTGLCGYSVVFYSIPIVVINTSLDDLSKRIVAAHELGHILLHRHILSEGILFEKPENRNNIRCEHEANLFAAELLIQDNDISENIKDHQDIFSLAGYLGLRPYLVNLKITSMRARGYDVVPPLLQSNPIKECYCLE